MRISILFSALLLISFSACQKEGDTITPINPDQLEMRSSTRPLKGTVYEVLVDEGDLECDCGDFFVGYGAGEGKMSHMGKVTSNATVCIEDILFDENGAFIETRVAGVCISLTAANGDELFLLGGYHVIRPDPDCACETAEVRTTITGGTGRFEGAGGWVDLFLSFDPSTEIYTEKYDGEISY